jgi:tetratricopeptide (TPR) repeat protein
MIYLLQSLRCFLIALALLVALGCGSFAPAQTDDVTGGEADPIKLFERGQDAHSKGNVERALAFYEEAIKLRPEFPEAEFQRGIALVSLQRTAEAEKSFRRAIDLRKDWSLPYTALADVLIRSGHADEAESLLRHAVQLGAKDYITLDALATLRLNAGNKTEALSLATRATNDEDAPASTWALRGLIERESGDKASAASSVAHALEIEPNNVAALKTSAELHADAGDYAHAIEDLKTALTVRPGNKEISMRLAKFCEAGGKPDEARRIYDALGYDVSQPSVAAQTSPEKGVINVVGAPADIEAANNDDPKIARPALEKLISANPKNAALLARLGGVTRTSDPPKSLECFAAANKIEPTNLRYATGYAAALVQSQRFAEAVLILRKVIAIAPDDYTAHTNLAIALFKLKQYAESLPVYEWIAANRPEIAATYFYIAIAHDNLGEYQEALDAYGKFMARADPVKDQLEIEKVNLRLPILRDQIKRGQGVKRKKGAVAAG